MAEPYKRDERMEQWLENQWANYDDPTDPWQESRVDFIERTRNSLAYDSARLNYAVSDLAYALLGPLADWLSRKVGPRG